MNSQWVGMLKGKQQICPKRASALPKECGETFKGEATCRQITGDKTVAL